jgi:hypothetical protein
MSLSFTTHLGVFFFTVAGIMVLKYALRKSGNPTAAEYF